MLNSSLIPSKKFKEHQTLKLQNGEYLFREGDLSREMYVIQKGAVEVFKTIEGSKVVLGQIPRGSMVGEMSLLESLPRSASACAIGETVLLVFDPGSFLLKIRRDPTFAFELMKHLSGRIRQTNEKLFSLIAAEHVSRKNLKEVIESAV